MSHERHRYYESLVWLAMICTAANALRAAKVDAERKALRPLPAHRRRVAPHFSSLIFRVES